MTDLSTMPDQETRLVAALRLARAWWPQEAAYSVRLALTSIFAMYLCMLFELNTPEWAGWTVISVSLATRANSLQKSLWRAVGTIIGAAVALAMVDAFAQDTLAFDIALALWLAFVTFMATIQRGLRTYGFALMGYTVPIVTLNDVQQPSMVFYTATDRCATLILGVACSYASSVLVARGVRSVRRALAGTMDRAVEDCARWAHAERGRPPGDSPPISTVLNLDTAIFDAFTEQPSLRTGGKAVAEAPITLLHLLTAAMLRTRLSERTDIRALLGADIAADESEWEHLDTARRDLRSMERRSSRRVPAKPLALDWDGTKAVRNAMRAVLAVSLTNAFWYVSNWPPGSGMVTWAALISVLYATRDDGAEVTRNFLVGALLASAVGIVVQYVILTASFSFPQLALVLLPLMMLATIGHSETQAAFGGGFAFLILDAVSPNNVMTYNLAASLNSVLATILGMTVAVMGFTFLVPPASLATRRKRAKRRMAKGVRAIGRPAWLLPTRATWVARMHQRLAIVDGDPGAAQGGQVLLLVGALLGAMRRGDDKLGRAAARTLWAKGDARAALDDLARDAAPLQRDRIAAITTLLDAHHLEGWPSGPAWQAAA